MKNTLLPGPVNPSNWMEQSLPTIGGLNLRQICIPGSHDAGMSQMNASTLFGFACNTQTQTTTIAGQLAAGVRYFDIRAVISGGQYATGHYSYISALSSYQGATGEYISDIISDIVTFFQTSNELVILDISHDMDTDVNYQPFNQDQWNALFLQLKNGLSQYLWTPPTVIQQLPNVDISTYPISDFISPNNVNKPAVVILLNPEMNGLFLGNYSENGFFLSGFNTDYPTILNNLGLLDDNILDDQRNTLISWFGSSCTDKNLQSLSDNTLIWDAQVWLYLNEVCGILPNNLAIMSLDTQRNAAFTNLNINRNSNGNTTNGWTVPQSYNNQALMQYAYTNLSIFNQYSGTNDLSAMESDQLTKMVNNKTTPNDPCFLASWTLTQDATQASSCALPLVGGASILDLANQANGDLINYFPGSCTTSSFPNILFIDNVEGSNVLNYVMEINLNFHADPLQWKVNQNTGQTTGTGPSVIYANVGSLNGYYCAFRANNPGEGVLIMNSPDGVTWPQNAIASGQSTSGCSPALALFNGSLYCAFESQDSNQNVLIMSSTDGVIWPQNAPLTNQSTGGGIALEVFNGKLYCAFKSNDDSNSLLIMYSSDGINWTAKGTGQSTGSGPALRTFNDQLYCLFTSNDDSNSLLWMSSSDGVTWPNNASSTGQSLQGQPSLAIVEEQLWCAFQSNDSSNRVLCIASDGLYWGAEINLEGASTAASPSLCSNSNSTGLLCMYLSNDPSNRLLFATGS